MSRGLVELPTRPPGPEPGPALSLEPGHARPLALARALWLGPGHAPSLVLAVTLPPELAVPAERAPAGPSPVTAEQPHAAAAVVVDAVAVAVPPLLLQPAPG